MSDALRLGAVVRRTVDTYGRRAQTLLVAAFLLTAVVKLDTFLFERSAAVGAGLINLFLLALFAGFVCAVTADGCDGGTPRGAGALLRSAWSAVGRLLLVGFVVLLALGLVGSLGWGILAAVALSAVLTGPAHPLALVGGVLLVSATLLVLELSLLTGWAVFVPVAVLERPAGLRSLGRSRELVRGRGLRVLVLVLMLALLLSTLSVADGSPGLFGGAPAVIATLILGTLIAPIPVVATTVLYDELRRTERAQAG